MIAVQECVFARGYGCAGRSLLCDDGQMCGCGRSC